MQLNSPYLKSFELDKEPNKNIIETKEYNAIHSNNLRRQNLSFQDGQHKEILTNTPPKLSMIVSVDDQHDIDMLNGLIEPIMPPEIVLLNSNYDLINYNF